MEAAFYRLWRSLQNFFHHKWLPNDTHDAQPSLGDTTWTSAAQTTESSSEVNWKDGVSAAKLPLYLDKIFVDTGGTVREHVHARGEAV